MLDPHQERNDDGHEHGGGLRGSLQRKSGGKGCEDGDSRGRRHPPVRLQGINASGDGEEHRRIELKKFSLRPEKYDRKRRLRRVGEPIRGVCHPGTVDRGGKIIALVPVPDHGSPYVLRRAAGTRKDGVRYQSGGPQASVWTGNGH